MTTTKNVSNNLDLILANLGQNLGRYQLKNYVFIFIPVAFSAMFTLSYVFTARNLDYRCNIRECDSENPKYNTPWLRNAVPFSQNGMPSRCEKYFFVGRNYTETCSADKFQRNVKLKCDDFVFDTEDVTILNDFDLTCEENMWKLTLVGTVNNIGQFVGLPISGYLSDRFGRRFLMLGGLIGSTIFGIIRSFSPSYIWFLVLEFLDPAFGSGAYSSGFILGVEQVSPEKRVLCGSIVSSSYAVGEAIVGLVAMCSTSWRWFLRYLYIPGIFLIAHFWLTPESVRWMVAKGKREEAKSILRKAAKMNKIHISETSLNGLDLVEPDQEEETAHYPFRDTFKSKILVLRLINCSFCWITCNFVFYGLSLNSVAVAGNIYVNFICVALIEIPAYFATYLIMDRLGRRYSLCGSLLLSGLACLSFIFIPEGETGWKLTTFLIGKFGITISFTVLYVFTTELFPTPLRHSLLGTCSMFGRTGSMIAPQTPLLAEVMTALPLILFSAMSVTSGVLVLAFPETYNTKLPDTIEEAENIGQKKENRREKEETKIISV